MKTRKTIHITLREVERDKKGVVFADEQSFVSRLGKDSNIPGIIGNLLAEVLDGYGGALEILAYAAAGIDDRRALAGEWRTDKAKDFVKAVRQYLT